MRGGTLGVFVGVLVSAGAVLVAQTSTRDLVGTVTDGHEPLRGAVVQVENEKTNSVISYVTDKSGQYSFKRLDAETDSSVLVLYRGHRSKPKELSHFDTNRVKLMNLVVKDE